MRSKALNLEIQSLTYAIKHEYSRHAGEEFIFVIAGTLEMRFENGTLTRLETGDSLYFDRGIGHPYASVGECDAEILIVCTGEGSQHAIARSTVAFTPQ